MRSVLRLGPSALSLVLLGCERPPPEPIEPQPIETTSDEVTPSQVTFTPPPGDDPAPAATVPPEEVEPGVAPTNAQTRGRLSPRKIDPVLKAADPAFSACYEAALRDDSSLRGSVTLVIVISEEGSVPHAEVSSGTSSPSYPKLSACLVTEAKKLQFERPTGGKVVTQYGLEFSPPPEAEQNLE